MQTKAYRIGTRGSPLALAQAHEARDRLMAAHGLPAEAFVAIYAGIHGIAQGLETVLHAADRLRNDRAVRFVLVGEGPVKAELLALRAELALDHVLMLPEQPRAAMPGILSAADAAMADPASGHLWLIVAGGEAALFRVAPGGALHGMFDRVALQPD